jgi:hypothetical protein
LRTVLKKIVWQQVGAELRRQMPEVAEVKSEPLPTACRLYGWKGDDALTFFAMFQVDRYDDAFTVEIGWSRDGHWPEAFSLKPPEPKDAEQNRGTRFRLGRLWMDKDVWWPVHEDTGGSQVRLQVEDAVRRLATEGVAYLHGGARLFAHKIPDGDAP